MVNSMPSDIVKTAIRSVAWAYFSKTAPRELERFKEVEKWVYSPPLRRRTFGPSTDQIFETMAEVFGAMVNTLRVKAAEIAAAESPEEIKQLFLEEIAQRLRTTSASEAIHMLGGLLDESPSLVDRIGMGAVWQKPLPEYEAGLERSTLRIIDPEDKSVSSGFILCKKGHILTAAHVVRGNTHMCVAYKNEKQSLAHVKWVDEARDIAVLEADKDAWVNWAGLQTAKLGIRELEGLRRLRVVCLGYQDPEVFLGPVGVEAATPLCYPIRPVRFEDGRSQEVLVLIIGTNIEHILIASGMSGGPVMDLETGEVIAMVVGAYNPTRRYELFEVYQPWRQRWELVSAKEFGFAVPLSQVAESWAEFMNCCLAGG